MISLNFRDSRPIYDQVKSGFIRLITTGVISPDEKLPSVREMATNLAINPNTIQKAYAQLEAEGYIYTVTGRGSFAASRDTFSDKRKKELMDELKNVLSRLADLDVSRDEVIRVVESHYVGKEEKDDKN